MADNEPVTDPGETPPAPPVTDPQDAPEPQAAGPMPMGIGIMRVDKQGYRDWITAGGTPPIYF